VLGFWEVGWVSLSKCVLRHIIHRKMPLVSQTRQAVTAISAKELLLLWL